MKKPYINYDEFELVCWDTDGNGTNVSLDLTKNQVNQICEIIGLLGFGEEDGKIVGYHKQVDDMLLTHINAERLIEEVQSLAQNKRFKNSSLAKEALQAILCWVQEEQIPLA